MSSPRHPKVFISYASPFQDAAIVVSCFLQSTFSLGKDAVFLAPASIGASSEEHDNFVASITKNALDADVFIILATRDYAQRFWCQYEALLRSTCLKTSQSHQSSTPLHDCRAQWFPVWIDRHANIATEFSKDTYLQLTGLQRAQGYRAWIAEDMRDFLLAIGALIAPKSMINSSVFGTQLASFLRAVGSLISPKSTIDWSASGSQLADEMKPLVSELDVPDMLYARLLDSLRESIQGTPIPLEFQANPVIDGAMTMLPCGYEGGKIKGYRLCEIAIVIENEPFAMPQDLEQDYCNFFHEKTLDPEQYWDECGEGDGDKLMLTKLPRTQIDRISAGGKVYLRVQPVKYSQVLFFKEIFLKDPGVVAKNLKDLADTYDAPFPSILCLHTVIVTQDEKIVVVRRAPTVHYYPRKYAATVEEQLHPKEDFKAVGTDRNISVEPWVRRALEEEVSLIGDHHFAREDARILSVFLEHTIMNLSLCALVRIKLDASKFTAHLASNLRKDYEFDRTVFFSADEALGEVVSPSLAHHPTSRYRMFMALLHVYGEDWIKTRLVDMDTKAS